jgi:large subunit ribosomal protein L23
MHWREIIRRPLMTEKSSRQASELRQYTFVVDSRANKLQIKEAIELAWPDVTVGKVRVANMPAKRARRWRRMTIRKPGWKKAIVTLSGGSIELFEGV